MPRFAANLTMLWNELPFLDRFAAAARAGFQAVECLFPYEHDPHDIAHQLQQHRLQLVLHNLPPGDWAAGERGLACLPGREADFRASIAQAAAYAPVLGVQRWHCMAGVLPPGTPAEAARQTYINNLRHAATVARGLGLQLLIEPLNPFDMPGYYLHSIPQALALMDEVGADNLRLQFDIYHAQRTQGELANTLRHCLPRIGHIQLADNPGRHEPGSGEIHYPYLFQQLDALGYQGWIGCEYKPQDPTPGGTDRGLGWLSDRLRAGLTLASPAAGRSQTAGPHR